MPRVTIKGGVWRNTEDEILKAAVMKYGLNQWSRIASLLHRKSSKQCKARWYDWLDPSIKKTEWSREEEEKLLHMAKLMPTQWRTIAPVVGRTAAQCLEHYQYLINKRLNGDDEVDDLRKLKPGEIDPAPETKPARPDPIDMDEDEIEMLSEARARLANTQGKKAKRKAREKQLEEARRLASLQKRRELKAAGIEMKQRRRKRGRIDYNAEIPFEKQPPPGFHDTTHEVVDTENPNFRRLRQDHLDKETRREKEQRASRSDQKRAEQKQMTSLLKDSQQGAPVRKRSKLVLPAPQISDVELEEVIKAGQVTQMTSSDPDSLLAADYSDSYVSSQLRTPMATDDRIMQEAMAIMQMTNVDTPLKGGLNTPIEADFKSRPNDAKLRLQTPNTILTPQVASTSGETPKLTTPIHDKLNINRYDATPIEREEEKRQIRHTLASLPDPTNNFEIVLPEDNPEGDDDQEVTDKDVVKDAADIEAERQQAEEDAEKRRLAQRHAAVRASLPRPTLINESIVRSNLNQLDELQMAEEVIKREMLSMLHYDVINHPAANQMKAKSKTTADGIQPYDVTITSDEMSAARLMLEEEVKAMKEAEPMTYTEDAFERDYKNAWQEFFPRLLYLHHEMRYTRVNKNAKSSNKDRIESLSKDLQVNYKHMTREAHSAGKLEKKLKVLTAGYQARSNLIQKQISETFDSFNNSRIQLNTFESLLVVEQVAIKKRMKEAEEAVRIQVEREDVLQERYGSLVNHLAELTMINGDQ